ncbi:MAG: hypothetical protein ACK5UE_06220 [Chitinophagales bacterium]
MKTLYLLDAYALIFVTKCSIHIGFMDQLMEFYYTSGGYSLIFV